MDHGKYLLEPDAREVKLPVWAQDTINGLRREYENERKRADAARLETDPEHSNAIIDAHDERAAVGLGDATVRFKLPGSTRNGAPYVECSVSEDGRLYVRGSDSIALAPWAGNVIKVWIAR